MRLFLAVELPPQVKQAAGGLITRLKRTGADVKWVATDNLHITLKFLGEVDPAMTGQIAAAAAEACDGQRAIALNMAGCGAFPSVRSPRVIWAGLGGEVARLGALAARIEGSLEPLGFEPERRPFKAHVTLGRLKGRPGAGLKAELATLGRWKGPEFNATKVVLFESTLRPAGPVYTPLKEIILPEEADG